MLFSKVLYFCGFFCVRLMILYRSKDMFLWLLYSKRQGFFSFRDFLAQILQVLLRGLDMGSLLLYQVACIRYE